MLRSSLTRQEELQCYRGTNVEASPRLKLHTFRQAQQSDRL